MLWSYGELSIQRTIVQTESLQKDVCSDRTERLWSLIMPWIKNIQWHVCHVAIPSKKARFQISIMHGYVYVYIDVVIQTLQIYIIRCFETINVRQLWIVAAVRLYNIWNNTFTMLHLAFFFEAVFSYWFWKEMPEQGTFALYSCGSFALTATTHLSRWCDKQA